MKKMSFIPKEKTREILSWLELSYVRAPLKPAKEGEKAYMNVKRT
jgi:hypothetical protein